MTTPSKHTIKHLAYGFSILFLLTLILHIFNLIPGFWGDKVIYLFYISLGLSFFFLFWEISEMTEEEKERSNLLSILSYLFLVILIILAINQFLKRQIILDFQLEIIVSSISLGILTFYSRRDKVEKDIDEEKQREEQEKARRKLEFPSRFPIREE